MMRSITFFLLVPILFAQAGFQTAGSFIIVSAESHKTLRVDKVDHRGVIQSSTRALWTIEHAGPDRYFIRAEDGRALDASPGNGDRVECARFNGGAYQRWSILADGEAFNILAHDGRALEILGSMDGARLHLANRATVDTQRFLLRRTESAR
jgi:hypothetical protein